MTMTETMEYQFSYEGEKFPSPFGPDGQRWVALFDAHGIEVRKRRMVLNWSRYYEIERERRLVWIVARERESGGPIGYSCHWWYTDMHFGDCIGHDDLWYVWPDYRGLGVGRRLKQMGHDVLKSVGVRRTYDTVRESGPTHALESLGFTTWGRRWMKEL